MIHRLHIPVLFLSLLAPACGDDGGGAETDATTDATTQADPGTTDDPTTGTPTTGEPDATTGEAPDFYACEEVMFGAAPLAGPLWDADKGGIQGTLQAEYVVHTTQIYIKPESAQQFQELATEVIVAAQGIDGLVAISVGSDPGCGVARTMGIWASEESMYALVATEAHAKAMGMTQALSYTGKVAHWKVSAEEANAVSWDVVRAKLVDVEPSPVYE
jgi:hypothetical protein